MTNLHLVAVYAGVNILLLLVLAVLVVGGRIRGKVLIGDGGDEKLLQAQRVHGNAVEYLPAGLVGLTILAVLNPEAPQWLIHAGGAVLTAGRLLHAIGMSMNPGRSFGRSVGILLTWTSYLVIGAALVALGLGVQL